MAFATKTIPGEVKRPTIRPRKNIPRKSGFLTKNNENLQITNKGKNIMHTFLFYFFRPDRPAHLGPILHFFHTFFTFLGHSQRGSNPVNVLSKNKSIG